MVGDRGMITSARIDAVKELDDRAAGPGDRHARPRRRTPADVAVRPAGPGRDHPSRLPG
jgi:hypothetical protein